MAQHDIVYAVEIISEKELNLTATLDAKEIYSDVDFVVIAAPNNVYPKFLVMVWWQKKEAFVHENRPEKRFSVKVRQVW